ncbi:MAG: type II secretion system inner membrane protein GspF [Bdellovibrionales bacterium]|nr:type II secretion system inner membrane protein GspF [Bdellovibrionales bacterium]
MPIYEYKALNTTGKTVKGVVNATNPTEAKTKLKRDGLYITEIQEAQSSEGDSVPGNIRFSKKVSVQELAVMTRQLSTLVGAGIPLVESLTALTEQVENVKLKKILSEIREKVNEGSTMASAMKPHAKVFSDLYINMIHAGESSGALETVLDRLADYIENQSKLKGKVLSAMAYPSIMVIVGIVALLIIFTFIIPKIVTLYKDLKQALPVPTQIMIGISKVFTSYWYIGLSIIVISFLSIRAYLKTKNGKYNYHRFLLRMPIFGGMFQMVAITRFASTLSTLLSSGVPILAALDIVKNVLENEVLTKVVQNVRNNVSEGDSISEPLRRSGEFPPMVVHMIAVGEKTGEVESMLGKVAQTYNNQLEAKISTLTSLIEPLMIVAMAIVIGFVVFSVMLPILNMGQALK